MSATSGENNLRDDVGPRIKSSKLKDTMLELYLTLAAICHTLTKAVGILVSRPGLMLI